MNSQLQRDLSQWVGARYAGEIARAWSAHKITLATETQAVQLRALRTYFKWGADCAVSSPKGAAAEVLRFVKRTGSLPSRKIVQASLSEFCSALEDRDDKTILQSRNSRTRLNLAHALSAVIKRLAAHGTFPRDLRVRLRLSKDPRERTRSLGELHQAQFGKTKSQSLPKLNARILAAIRQCAEKDLLQQDELASIRARVIKGATSKTQMALATVAASLRNSDHGSRDTPSELEVAEIFLANRFKSRNFSRGYWRQGRPMIALVKHFGAKTLDRWLGPTSIDFSAAYLMALCDTGWNVAPLYSLEMAGITIEANSGKIYLSSVKRRARGKRVRARLDADMVTAELWKKRKGARISPASNVERWQASIKQFCDLTGVPSPPPSSHFWILPLRPGYSLSRPSGYRVWQWIEEFKAKHKDNPVFGNLKFSAKNIRPSVLQVTNGGEPHQQLQTQMKAGHSGAGTTFTYLRSDQFLSDLKKYIRQFQDLIQAAMTRGIKGASVHFGIPQGRLDFLNKLARRQGPSLFKSATDAPRKTGGGTAKTKLSLKLFAASQPSMEALYLTHKTAKLSLERGPVDERWARVWLPFYALLEVLIEKIKKSPYSRAYRDVADRAESKLRSGKVALPTIY